MKNSVFSNYKVFTGNMSGMLICEYEMSQKKALGILPDNGALVTTIVSSNMAQAVAKEYGMKFIECLTGFKYIGEQIKFFEQTGSNEYVFGFEESYGCLVGTHARDKDAVVAVMALCEAAAYYKTQGITLWDQMLNIYNKYGYYKEDLFTMTFKGADGAKKMQDMMHTVRTHQNRLVHIRYCVCVITKMMSSPILQLARRYRLAFQSPMYFISSLRMMRGSVFVRLEQSQRLSSMQVLRELALRILQRSLMS